MAFIPVPNGVMAVVEYGSSSIRWSNTLWFSHPDVDHAELVNHANNLMNTLEVDFVPFMSDIFSIQKVTCYDMSASDGPVGVSTREPVAGENINPPAPVSACMVLTLRSADRGRSSRGRNFLTGFAETDVGATVISNQTLIDDVTDAFEDLITGMAAIGFPWQVCSRYTLGAPRANGVLFPIVTVNVRNAGIGSQRRRLQKG